LREAVQELRRQIATVPTDYNAPPRVQALASAIQALVAAIAQHGDNASDAGMACLPGA
jgi:hypothetical protein